MTNEQHPFHRTRSISRLRNSGMTLFEVMIVVIIIAAIGTAVGVAVLPQLKKSRIKQTGTDAQSVRAASVLYLAENAGGECPTTEALVSGDYLDKSKSTTDAWGNEFQIECDGDNVAVLSAGPDGQFGSEDDIP